MKERRSDLASENLLNFNREEQRIRKQGRGRRGAVEAATVGIRRSHHRSKERRVWGREERRWEERREWMTGGVRRERYGERRLSREVLLVGEALTRRLVSV